MDRNKVQVWKKGVFIELIKEEEAKKLIQNKKATKINNSAINLIIEKYKHKNKFVDYIGENGVVYICPDCKELIVKKVKGGLS